MSNGNKNDYSLTLDVLDGKKKKHLENGDNWLRHKAGSQSYRIDGLLLEGKYTREDIINILIKEFGKGRIKDITDKNIRSARGKKLEDHLNHLDEKYAHNMEPHKLLIQEDNFGMLHFSRSGTH